jgi:DNA gyrase subunit A
MARSWRSSLVEDMLSRVSGAYPEGLLPEFGLVGGQERGYYLSDAQAQAILELRLQRLTGLEQDKIVGEYREVMDKITDLLDILAKPARVTQIIGDELITIRSQFGDKRRSEIITHTQDMSMEDLIAPEDVVVTMSHGGYMKAQRLDEYRAETRRSRQQATATRKTISSTTRSSPPQLHP